MHVLAPNEFRVCSAVILISWELHWHKNTDTLTEDGRESRIFRVSSVENDLRRA